MNEKEARIKKAAEIAYETLKHFPPDKAKKALEQETYCLSGEYVRGETGIT